MILEKCTTLIEGSEEMEGEIEGHNGTTLEGKMSERKRKTIQWVFTGGRNKKICERRREEGIKSKSGLSDLGGQ